MSSERGASLVEMALVMPLLLLLIVGVIDLGRALWTDLALKDAAQEGALYGSFAPTADIEQRVRLSSDLPIDLSDSSVVVTPVVDCVAGEVTVTVEHELPLITPIVGQMFGGSIHLHSTVTGTVFGDCP